MSTTFKISLEQYDLMIRAGTFDGKHRQRIELIHGELRPMSPINPPHAWYVSKLTDWSSQSKSAAQVKFHLTVQCPLWMPESESAPEPDIVWSRPADYRHAHPEPEDVLLLIEVADSSLEYDRGEKAYLYAAAGIKDYWIVNLNDRVVEVHRDPLAGAYESTTVFHPGETLRPLTFPEIELVISELLDN